MSFVASSNAMILGLLLLPLGHTTFEACLRSQLPASTPLLVPGDEDYLPASQCLNRRSDIAPSPVAVVRVQSVSDVQHVVRCAGEFGLEVSTRCGAHSFENESCRGQVIIDVSDLLDFSYDSDTQQTTWGSGHTSGELYMKLGALNVTVPGGMEGDVGTAGLWLGCGRGPFTQYMGNSCRRLQAVEYVDDAGHVRVANVTENSDMLWMARGAGGEFPGVVTKFTALAAPKPTTIHTRACDRYGAFFVGQAVIREWARGLEETARSRRKMYSYIHFFPNTGMIWVRHKCFDCDADDLAWFIWKTSAIAQAAGGQCGDVKDHSIGPHPDQFVNFLAVEPGVGNKWETLLRKPHDW